MWKNKICLFIIIVSFSCDDRNVASGNFSFLVTGNVQGELYPKKMRRGSLGVVARRSTYINKVKDINLDIKCDLLREGPEPVLKNRIHNKIVDKTSIESTSNKNDLITDIIDYNEKNKLVDITEQLKSNPYSVSIV